MVTESALPLPLPSRTRGARPNAHCSLARSGLGKNFYGVARAGCPEVDPSENKAPTGGSLWAKFQAPLKRIQVATNYLLTVLR